MHKVILRADGNTQIGLGHVYRLIAMCEILSPKFECHFAIHNPGEKVKELIQEYCPVIELMADNPVQELEELKGIISKMDTVVLDGYNFNIDYMQSLRQLCDKLVVVDDMADRPLSADIIINHGRSGIEDIYKGSGAKKILCGFDYLLLRKQFLQAAKKQRQVNEVNSLLICMGGADINNLSQKFLQAVQAIDFIKRIVIITGSAYKHSEELKNYTGTIVNKKVEIYNSLGAAQMMDVIQSCQLAISPASTTSLEICCIGAGLITGYSADNQKNILAEITEKGCGVSMGEMSENTVNKVVEYINRLQDSSAVNEMINMQRKAFGNNKLLDSLTLN